MLAGKKASRHPVPETKKGWWVKRCKDIPMGT
jgi:hypothetical protein